MKKALASLIILASSLGVFAADSLTGKWAVETDIAGNNSSTEASITQDGNKLTGSIKGPDGKELKITGEVADKKVSFKYTSEWEGNPLTMVYTGTLNAAGSQFEGSTEVQPMGIEGTFTAKKN